MANGTGSPQILQCSYFGRCGASWTECTCGQLYVYVQVQLKSELQHTGTWVAAAWPPYFLYYHQAVFFCHVCLIAHILKMLLLKFLYFLKIA
jgi:hypothetical protein